MLQALSWHKTAEASRKYARGGDWRGPAVGAVGAIVAPIAGEVKKRKRK